MIKNQHFSSEFNLNVKGHCDVEFIDINLYKDTRLYLDPCLIEARTDYWGRACSETIASFFNTVFKCKLDGKGNINALLDFGHEPNETKLGMSSGKPMGKGASAEILNNVITEIIQKDLLEKGMIENPMDITLFIKNFDKDRMSDLITNIIRLHLYQFTIKQCEKYGIDLSEEEVVIGKYWDICTESWQELRGKELCHKGKRILLVPKNIVRNNPFYSAKSFVWQKLIEYRQSYHYNNKTNLVVLKYDKNDNPYYDKPTKDTVYQSEIKGHCMKELASEFVENNPASLIEFREEMSKISNDKVLSDDVLDRIVYSKNIKIA